MNHVCCRMFWHCMCLVFDNDHTHFTCSLRSRDNICNNGYNLFQFLSIQWDTLCSHRSYVSRADCHSFATNEEKKKNYDFKYCWKFMWKMTHITCLKWLNALSLHWNSCKISVFYFFQSAHDWQRYTRQMCTVFWMAAHETKRPWRANLNERGKINEQKSKMKTRWR